MRRISMPTTDDLKPSTDRANVSTPSPGGGVSATIAPQGANGKCECGGNSNGNGVVPFVYALGRIEARFPSLSVEKEFAQATGRGGPAGLSDRQTLHAVLSKRENRY